MIVSAEVTEIYKSPPPSERIGRDANVVYGFGDVTEAQVALWVVEKLTPVLMERSSQETTSDAPARYPIFDPSQTCDLIEGLKAQAEVGPRNDRLLTPEQSKLFSLLLDSAAASNSPNSEQNGDAATTVPTGVLRGAGLLIRARTRGEETAIKTADRIIKDKKSREQRRHLGRFTLNPHIPSGVMDFQAHSSVNGVYSVTAKVLARS